VTNESTGLTGFIALSLLLQKPYTVSFYYCGNVIADSPFNLPKERH
jgi:hypothetical protein